jgi:hypothetical protein
MDERTFGRLLSDVLRSEMSVSWEVFRANGGRQHPRTACRASAKAGGPKHCVIHNPSRHHMREWPLLLRSTTLLERVCPHGVGHPDPDSAAFLNWHDKTDSWLSHGCHFGDDGRPCCAEPEETHG